MNKSQDEMIKLSKVLEKKGYHITEFYNAANFLRVFVNGEQKSLWQMSYLARRK